MNIDFPTKTIRKFICLVGAVCALNACGGGSVGGSPTQAEGPTGSLRPGIRGEIMIGVMLPYSGTVSANYDSRERYLRLAVVEINEAGGVNGKTLGYMVRDTKAGTTEGSAALIDEYLDLVNMGCIGVIGPLTSGEALQLAPIVLKTGVPIIGTGPSTNELDNLQRGDPSVFYRLIVSNSFSASAAAKVAVQDGKKTVAIIHSNDSFGNSARDTFASSFQARGGTVLATSAFQASQTSNFSSVINKAFENGQPDAIYIAAQSAEAVGLSKDIASLVKQPRPSFYAASAISNSQFINSADASVVDGMVIMGADNNPNRIDYLTFADLYNKRYGEPPDVGISPSGYDAVYLFALAAQAGKSTDKQSIATWLGPVSRPDTATPFKIGPGQFSLAIQNPNRDWDFEGAKSAVNWDKRGDLSTGSFIVYRVVRNSAGQFSLVQINQITPD